MAIYPGRPFILDNHFRAYGPFLEHTTAISPIFHFFVSPSLKIVIHIVTQAICDAFCRFTGYCFNSPRNVGDSIAYKKWKLSQDVVKLPSGFYIVGDNAYPLSSSLLVP
ncbi:hypothetical protein PHMEG_00041022 [Phytophthora megakarya]|uniref:DDE Tnp4 domain-containing protein n=1 Tax=Phytophthora megakarya TaxID=4795 RepID=A0A225UF24_9STRA|nr:hypothetical protein PHMEG_00041022 [Phytophthora megakarya]